jgi:hypothetical protein
MEDLYRDEITELQQSGRFDEEITNLVSNLITTNFPFWTKMQPVEAM